MTLRISIIHRATNRSVLFMGGDLEMVMMSGLLAAVLVFATGTRIAFVFGILLWFFMLWALRLMAKSDPYMRWVYMRSLRYSGTTVRNPDSGQMISGYLPPRSTPFRNNTNSQGAGYK